MGTCVLRAARINLPLTSNFRSITGYYIHALIEIITVQFYTIHHLVLCASFPFTGQRETDDKSPWTTPETTAKLHCNFTL